ncbi:MAG TPA: enoyl-CoA hydratase/isomerase family protein [Deltaproteobacteria bacterium]|nr:enoyl-CoA hydratase/isomerase family protein [Deltaproteobacteria bacterium]
MSWILFEQQNGIGRLTLNNPEALNAMTPEMGDAIAALVPKLNADPELRVVLVQGAGRAFSAGGNLQFILDHESKDFATNKKEMIEFYSKFLQLRNIEVPTIAVLNGHAIGAGLLIALACDLRYASAEAKLAVNFAKIGLSSGMGGLYWLSTLAGPAIAAELLFTAKTFSAEEGLQKGLVNGIFPAAELEAKVREIAEQIAANAPLAIKTMKKGIQKAKLSSLEEIFDYESAGQAQSFVTEDLKEGIRAIQEKRAPRFRGR